MYGKGINQENIQLMNRELVLRVLRKNEGCSRAELAKMTNLKPATITNIINDFQKMNLVGESGTISEGKGRSAIRLMLNPKAYNVVGIRLSRSYLIVGVFDVRGDELKSVRYEIERSMTSKEVIVKIIEYANLAIHEWAEGQVAAIGCAVPGPYLRKEGRIALMTGFPVWNGVNIQKELEAEFDLPIFMEHDANAGALAHYWKQGIELQQTLVYVAVGQGVGAGIVQNGSLIGGQLGVAGEFGHMSISFDGRYCECGNRGCLETYCSSIAFEKEVQREIEQGNYSCLKKDCSFGEIVQAVRNGDRLAQECYQRFCDRLSVGIVNVINMLNPDTIVIDEEMVGVAPEILQERLEKVVQPSILPELWNNVKIVIGEGTQTFVLKGVAIFALEKILRDSFAR